jgi:hypothetical protein
MSPRSAWLAISAVWLACAFGGGALLALLYRRLHPSLSFHKLWALWTTVLSLAAALVFWLAWG